MILGKFDDAVNNKKFLSSFTDNKLCGNNEWLLLSLPTKRFEKNTCFLRNQGKIILKLVTINRTTLMNSTTKKYENIKNIILRQKKYIQNSKIYKENPEENQPEKDKSIINKN